MILPHIPGLAMTDPFVADFLGELRHQIGFFRWRFPDRGNYRGAYTVRKLSGLIVSSLINLTGLYV